MRENHHNSLYCSWIATVVMVILHCVRTCSEVRNRTVQVIAFSMLYVTGQCESLLHCEHGCSVDTTQLIQLVTVGCLVVREVGSAAVCVY